MWSSNYLKDVFCGTDWVHNKCKTTSSCNIKDNESSSCPLCALREWTWRTGDSSFPCFWLKLIWVWQPFYSLKTSCLWSGREHQQQIIKGIENIVSSGTVRRQVISNRSCYCLSCGIKCLKLMVERKLPAKGSAGSFVCYFRRISTVISGGCFKHQVGLDDVPLCLSYLLFVLLTLLATSLNLHKPKVQLS